MDIAVLILLSLILTVLPWFSQSGGEGRYRRGPEWYLDVSARPEGPVPAYQLPERKMTVSSRAIRVWGLTGLGLVVLAVTAWLLGDAEIAAVVIGLVGLAYLGKAVEAWRENRWIRGPDR
jgi:hypothetical protein